MEDVEGNAETVTPSPSALLSSGKNNGSSSCEIAVGLGYACKMYGRGKNANHVLQDLNMTVIKGSIYGLLGASGCGKTTLLSCIVGRKHLNSGELLVLGGKPGTKGSGVPGNRVGYMPQEIALYGEFTIRETMMYFGWIFNMETPDIAERLTFLLKFLDLPPESRFVKNLSGGQQRRVSFAVALMHDPELLILDEPTVGVDPLLRQSIWNHLVQITREGNKTVIITTHYIEEARQAHTIGLMRGGKLLAEESPSALLTMYKSPTLEEVFLKLSREQEQNIELPNQSHMWRSNSLNLLHQNEMEEPSGCVFGEVQLNKNQNVQSAPVSNFWANCRSFTTTGKTKALVLKNCLRMWRNIGFLLFIFALPVIQINLFCLAIGRDPTGLRMAIVNEEADCQSVADKKIFYTCRYLDFIDKETIIKVDYDDLDSATKAVESGAAWGTVYFSKEFTTALNKRMMSGNAIDNTTFDQSEIKVKLDMSDQQIGLMLIRALQFAYGNLTMDILKELKKDPRLAEVPVRFLNPIYGSKNLTFTNFVAPGIILSIIFFLAVSLTSTALMSERLEGMLDRSWVAGVSPGEILFSHIVTQFLVMCVQTTLVLIFMILMYKVECQGNIGLVIILTLLGGLCGMCFGFVISAICDLERTALQLALGSFYPTILLSGIIWPSEGMPVVLQYISFGLPLTMATSAMRSILTRGWSITEPLVYYAFISVSIWIIIFLTLSMIVLRMKRGSA